MIDASHITPRMAVLGSDGGPIGTVDAVEGDRIRLTRADSSDGEHPRIPLTDVARVDTHVHLHSTTATAGALFGAGPAGAMPINSVTEATPSGKDGLV